MCAEWSGRGCRCRDDIGGRAALDALDGFQARAAADGELMAEQVELMPGRPARDIKIAAKAQRLDRRARRVLQRSHRGQIDVETTFLATSEKLWFCPYSTLGGPRSSLVQ